MTSPLDPVSDTDLERLSALLDGDLPPAEAEALQARLLAEPALAGAWVAMQALPGSLSQLPTECPVPTALNAEVLAARTTRRRPGFRRPWLPLALAALALLVLRAWPGSPQLELVEGEQVVDGDLALAIAGGRIEIDGRARIRVEPTAGLAREEGQDPRPEDSMKPAPLALGTAAGALVTIAVYEGSATLHTAQGATTVEAGEERSIRTDGAPLRQARRTPPARSASLPPPAPLTLDEANSRIAALEEEVATLRFERDLQQGAIQTLGGEPMDWPKDVHPAFKEPAFTETIRGAIAENEALELLGVDCSEYPCIAMVRAHTEDEGWSDVVNEKLTESMNAVGVEDPNVGFWISRTKEDEDSETLTLAGIVLGDPKHGGEDVQTRNDLRLKEWSAEVTEELRAAPEP